MFDSQVSLFTNPTKSIIGVQGEEVIGKSLAFELYSTAGQLVYDGFASTNCSFEIDVSNDQNGLYMLHLYGEDD